MAEPEGGAEATKDEIGREVARVHLEAYGAKVFNCQVSVFEDSVCVTMDIELAPNEQTLLEAGSSEAVQGTREAFQDAIRPTFSAIVERSTGRTVVGFASRTILEGDPWSTEIFRLAPRG